MNGVILVDKPSGFTSFDVIAVVRGLTKQRKAGHTGTLDPNATGVLPVLLGRATKAQDLILNHDKTYEADFRLGLSTDTLDIWGRLTAQSGQKADRAAVEAALKGFLGEIEQIPPMYSAVQKDGKRLYDLARQGIEVERESRRVNVYSLELICFDEQSQSGRLKLSCSKGTYVRTLIDDMGTVLKTGAVMTALRRTNACGFDISRCATLDTLRKLAENGELESVLLPVESLFEELEAVNVSAAQAKRFSNGGELDLCRTALKNRSVLNGTLFRVSSREAGFLGLGETADGMLKIKKLF